MKEQKKKKEKDPKQFWNISLGKKERKDKDPRKLRNIQLGTASEFNFLIFVLFQKIRKTSKRCGIYYMLLNTVQFDIYEEKKRTEKRERSQKVAEYTAWHRLRQM